MVKRIRKTKTVWNTLYVTLKINKRVCSSCSTSGTRRVALITTPRKGEYLRQIEHIRGHL